MRRSIALVTLCTSLAACTTPAPRSAAVPVEQKPAHRLILQNDYVRMFDVTLPPGKATLWHVHRHDGASVRLEDATIEDQPMGGTAETARPRRGEVTYGATPVARTHRVTNVGDTNFHIIYIELLQAPGAVAPAASPATDSLVVLENDRIRALRRILAPGESSAFHTHVLKAVGVPVTDGRVEVVDQEGKAITVEVKAGAAAWVEPGTTHRLKNVGVGPLEFVDIELK
jgi:quercetin dioxygenase-like cupin family protein